MGSLFVCLFAAVLVGILKLYQQTVYRLALYQVLAALVLGTVLVVEVIFVNYSNAPEAYHYACVAVAFFLLYSMWMKVVCTVWLTVHVFCYAVMYKNLKKLEGIYVATSLLIPALISLVPFTTHTYGLAGSWCWIENWKDNCPTETLTLGMIEQFALWFGPSMLILLVEVFVMITMVIILVIRLHRRRKYEPITRDDPHWKALKQLLPLSAYPILFCIFNLMPFINRVYGATPHPPNHGLLVTSALGTAIWNTITGSVFITHVAVAKLSARKVKCDNQNGHHSVQYGAVEKEGTVVVKNESTTPAKSHTYVSSRTESI